MGSEILEFYHEKVKKTWKLAFCAAFVIGLLVHIYRFTNLLPNHDAVYNFYSSQNMVASGRWFLSIACSLGSWFDLPWINAMLSLTFMGLTAAAVTEVFDMKNPCLIVVSSGLLVSFPAITATMHYEFTADGYMIAMFLAAISICLTRMEFLEKQYWKRLVLSSACICLSCGIYQAYASFAFILAVCYFMTQLLENRWEEKRYWRWIGLQFAIFGVALAAYYLIWKIALVALHIPASTYLGIDQVGVMGAKRLVYAVMDILRVFVRFFLEWNILKYGVTIYSVLNILFLAAFVLGLAQAVQTSGCRKNRVHLLLLFLCVASLPFGCYVWMLTSPHVTYRIIMLQSVCILYIFVAVIFDRWIYGSGRKRQANAALLLLTAIVFNNSVTANMSYAYMEKCYEKTYANAVELTTRVHLLDDGTIRYVALCGTLEPWQQEDHFDPSKLRHLGAWKHMDKTILTPQFLSLYTDFDLSYYKINNLEYPIMENEPNIPAPYNWEFRFPTLSAADSLALAQTEEVRSMPVWPARDSVKVLGDTIVVKLSEAAS